MTFRGQYKNGVVVFVKPPALAEGATVEVAPISDEIEEHDVVRVLKDVQVEGQKVRSGMTGAVVSVYENGKAFGVEFVDLPGGPDVVTLFRDQIERAQGVHG